MKFDKKILGECLHTALRKCCDSHITSAAWHLIYALPQDIWHDYLTAVYEQVIVLQEHPSEGMISGAVREASLNFDAYKYEKNAQSLAWTLKLIFECFTLNDWNGYTAFLWDELQPKEAKKGA